MPKAVFIDVDNTLWDKQMIIPESAKEAVRQLHENGHLPFLCTGRGRGNLISAELMSLPFAGVIAACGNHIEIGGELLYEQLIPEDTLKEVIDVAKQFDLPIILEGPKDHWMSEHGFGQDDPYVTYLHQTLGSEIHPLRGYEEGMKINKVSALILPQTDYLAILWRLEEKLHFIKHPVPVLEIVPKGSSKARGIDFVCKKLGISPEDTYAIGDSSNDKEMLSHVIHSIAMGNADQSIRQLAEFVTDDIYKDGFYKAMKQYGLI